MKIVINRCFGGFSISLLAIKRLCEIQCRECYFYEGSFDGPYKKITLEEAEKKPYMVYAFTVGNEDELNKMLAKRSSISEQDEIWKKIHIDSRPESRDDPDLIKVVQELGEKANGQCADLKIIEIPDDVNYEIDEYDGCESIHEVHRSWS
jgi:hypothetical protein